MTKRWRKCGANGANQWKTRICLPACCSFSEFLLSYGDGDPSKPHLNQGTSLEFRGWDLYHFAKFGIFWGYSLNTLKYPKMGICYSVFL